MNLKQLKASLNSENLGERLRALTELKHYETAVAVPLLISKLNDPELIVRSFVAMGLGQKQAPESFAALVQLLNCDRDPNVRAEAAHSLSQYGDIAIPHLVCCFCREQNWLVQRSILEPLIEAPHPEALYEICVYALAEEEQNIQNAAIQGLSALADTEKQMEALQHLLNLVGTPHWRTRVRVALALRKFSHPWAQEALQSLTTDNDHRVVGAAPVGSL